MCFSVQVCLACAGPRVPCFTEEASSLPSFIHILRSFPFTQTKANEEKMKTHTTVKGLQRRSRTCLTVEGTEPTRRTSGVRC